MKATRDGDDPDRWKRKDYLAAMIAGPIAGVPFIGGVFEYVIRSTVGTHRRNVRGRESRLPRPTPLDPPRRLNPEPPPSTP